MASVMPMSKRLIAVGAICNTTIYRVDHVPSLPAKLLASAMTQVVDGMALSAAYALVRLGGSAKIWARVGDDELAVSMRHSLSAEGLNTDGLHTVPGTVTSQATVIVDRRGDRLVVPFHDPRVDQSASWLPVDEIAQTDFVHCDTRWVEGAETALKAARERNVPCMIDGDVAPLAVLQRLIPLATHAVFSDAGLLIYSGCDDVMKALIKVGSTHGGHVGASCGANGYYWFEQGQVRHVNAPAIKVIDTLSAGDVFHGAFALALLEGKDVENAARFACAAASLKCTRFGGRLGCPTRPEVDSLVAATY